MGNKGSKHYSGPKGKKLVVKLRNGTIIKGKFTEKRSKYIVIDSTKIQRDDIDSVRFQKHEQIFNINDEEPKK